MKDNSEADGRTPLLVVEVVAAEGVMVENVVSVTVSEVVTMVSVTGKTQKR